MKFETETVDPVRRGWTSASNAAADEACPGRHLAQRGIPEPAKSSDATSGTRIHQALADSGDPLFMKSLSLEERETFDTCRQIEKKTVANYFGDTRDPMRVFRHRRFWVKFQNAADGTIAAEHSGEADVVWRAGTRLLIADYKTLAGDTPGSPRNLQLRDLAVLARGELMPITEVATVIVQPLVTHSPEICIYSEADLARSEQELFTRVLASNNPESPRLPGEMQCQFCLAKTRCLEYQKWAGAITPPQMLSVLEVPIISWTPEQRAIAANALGPALFLLEQIKTFFKDGLAKDPAFIPGWTLAAGARREAITNPQECFTRFAALGGTLEQFMRTISVGKGKLREALNGVTGAKGLNLDKAMDTLTEGITQVSQNAPSLKRLEDK